MGTPALSEQADTKSCHYQRMAVSSCAIRLTSRLASALLCTDRCCAAQHVRSMLREGERKRESVCVYVWMILLYNVKYI